MLHTFQEAGILHIIIVIIYHIESAICILDFRGFYAGAKSSKLILQFNYSYKDIWRNSVFFQTENDKKTSTIFRVAR